MRLNGLAENTKPKFLLNDSLKAWMPKNHSFKGLPIEFRSSDSTKIIDRLLKYGGVSEILERANKPGAKLGVRCKIFPYPEDRLAVWVMVACVSSEAEQ